MAAIAPEKLKELMLKVRKGATSSFTLAQIQAIVEALGGKAQPIVGFVKGIRRGERNEVYADSEAEAQQKYEALKKFLVKSLPAKPKVGVMYVTKLDAPQVRHGDSWEVEFDSVTAAAGLSVELDGKKEDFLPGIYHVQEARDYLERGPRKEAVYPYEITKWLTTQTDWVARANAFLGLEEHVPADARTRDRTGSCPVCFQNVKLAPNTNTIVLHGYKRPGYGQVQGKCFGVGFLPFELSSEGCKEYVQKDLQPALKNAKASLNSLMADDITSFTPRGTLHTVKKGDRGWEIALSDERARAKRFVEAIEDEIAAFERLISHWQVRPLPKEGEKHIDWFSAGQKTASMVRVASSIRLARAFILKRAFDTKKWGPFVFEIDRPKGFKKEWPQEDGSVKKYTYPVDYGYFVGHTGEDEEGLDAFVGEDPEGPIESFLKLKPAEDGNGLVPDETKFLVGLSDSEREKVMGLYKPDEIVELRSYNDFYDLVEALNEFRDRQASMRVAARFRTRSGVR